jgi:hypothetical protein
MAIYNPAPEAPATLQAAVTPTDLNQIIRDVFAARKTRMDALHTIMRCDALPSVAAPAQDLAALFGGIMDMLLENPPAKSQLYIYIRCEPDLNTPAERWSQHKVSIHSNSLNNCAQPVPEDFRSRCAQLCSSFGGSFRVLSGSSCFFDVNLPGKFPADASR